MKKTLFTTMILIGWLASSTAQVEMAPCMVAFKEYCIRVSLGAAACDVDQLTECIKGWNPPKKARKDSTEVKLVYKNQKIIFNTFGYFNTIDTTDEVSTNGHFMFLPAAVDTFIATQCEVLDLAEESLVRGPTVNCEYVVRALKPHGKATYYTRGTRQMEMFVVTETKGGGKIKFYVHATEKNFKGDILNEIDLEDAPDGGREYAQLVWNMNRNGDVFFTVENTSDNAISFIVVRN